MVSLVNQQRTNICPIKKVNRHIAPGFEDDGPQNIPLKKPINTKPQAEEKSGFDFIKNNNTPSEPPKTNE